MVMSTMNFCLVKHVTRLKVISVPCLKLLAAVTTVRVNHIIAKTLEVPIERIVFWTDSTTVLRYIRNDRLDFILLRLTVCVIHDGSQVEQRSYINSALNPTDDASRGKQCPEFLCKEEGE